MFGPDKPKAAGRPKYMLVDETMGKEVDIAASFCIPIKARFMKRTLDADKEEWDIIDDGSMLTDRISSKRRSSIGADSFSTESSARKKAPSIQMLSAIFPGSSAIVSVRLVGVDDESQSSPQRKRGRPIGSKNRTTPPAHRGRRTETTPTSLSSASSLSTLNLDFFITNTKKKAVSGPIAKQPKKRKGAAVASSSQTKKMSPEPKSSKSKVLSPLTPGSSRKRSLTSSSPKPSSKRARRSAAPRFLGENVIDFDDKSDKIPYNPPKKAANFTATGSKNSRSASFTGSPVKTVATTNKRWHPIRETRNGKLTPRSRRSENQPSPSILRASPRILNSMKSNVVDEKPKAKPTPYEIISRKRSVGNHG